MTRFKLIRKIFLENVTGGELFLGDLFLCYTLEDTDRKLEEGGVKIPGKTAIPRGVYDLVLDYSIRFKRILPHLLDVEDFEGIRIHAGNTEADTEGCVLLGEVRSVSDNSYHIEKSRAAFLEVFKRMQAIKFSGEAMEIEIA